MAGSASNAMLKASYDPIADLFEPDVVLPGQYSEKYRGLRGGERKLMAALLSDGIEAYILQSTRAPRKEDEQARDVSEWVNTRDYSYVFSFDVVCESLGIDPEYLRLGLRRYVQAAKTLQAQGQSVSSVWKRIRRPRRK